MADGLKLNDSRPFVQDKRGFAPAQLSSLKHSASGKRLTLMSSIGSTLGLSAGSPCYAPYYLMANFLFAHAVLVPRTFKQYYGIDRKFPLGPESIKSFQASISIAPIRTWLCL